MPPARRHYCDGRPLAFKESRMNTTIDCVDRSIIKKPVRRMPHTATEAARLLADIRALAPSIAARAAEIEAARRIPLDLVETLRSIGVFRMFAPQSHGG